MVKFELLTSGRVKITAANGTIQVINPKDYDVFAWPEHDTFAISKDGDVDFSDIVFGPGGKLSVDVVDWANSDPPQAVPADLNAAVDIMSSAFFFSVGTSNNGGALTTIEQNKVNALPIPSGANEGKILQYDPSGKLLPSNKIDSYNVDISGGGAMKWGKKHKIDTGAITIPVPTVNDVDHMYLLVVSNPLTNVDAVITPPNGYYIKGALFANGSIATFILINTGITEADPADGVDKIRIQISIG